MTASIVDEDQLASCRGVLQARHDPEPLRIGTDEAGRPVVTAGVAFGDRPVVANQEINPDNPPVGMEVLVIELPQSVLRRCPTVVDFDHFRRWCLPVEIANGSLKR